MAAMVETTMMSLVFSLAWKKTRLNECLLQMETFLAFLRLTRNFHDGGELVKLEYIA